MKRAAVVIVLRRRVGEEARVLAVTNRRYGGISLPGGKVEDEEDDVRAVIREAREETALVLLSMDLVLVIRAPSAIVVDDPREVAVFFARHALGRPHDVEDGTHCTWVTFEELVELSPFRAFYTRYFPGGFEHLRDTVFDSGPPSR